MVAVPRVAQSLALVGLLCVSTALLEAEPHAKKLVIFLASDTAITPSVSSEIKQEVGHLMQSASIHVEWRDPAVDRGGMENDYLVVIRMRGSCHSPEPSTRFEHAVSGTFPLASSAVADGVILPFGDVDCAALNSFLGPSLWKESDRVRDFEYARAVARLMAHELYHIVGQTSVHAHTGVAKPEFTVAELLGDRFEFNERAMTDLHPSPDAAEYSRETDPVDASGK
jgi:hypothetical protein